MRTSNLILGLVIAGLAMGCKRGDDEDTETDDTAIDDTGETSDTETDDPSDTETDDPSDSETDDPSDTSDPIPEEAPQGFAFCAAGGRVTGATHSGVICLGPLDVAGGLVEGSSHTWQAGPIYVIAP